MEWKCYCVLFLIISFFPQKSFFVGWPEEIYFSIRTNENIIVKTNIRYGHLSIRLNFFNSNLNARDFSETSTLVLFIATMCVSLLAANGNWLKKINLKFFRY